MFARRNRMRGALYALVDALLALASFALAHWVRAHVVTPRPFYPASHYAWVIPLAVGILLLVGFALGIYRDTHTETVSRAFRNPLKVSFISTSLLFAVTFAIKFEFISRLLLGFYAVIDLAAMILFRLMAPYLAGPVRRTFSGFQNYLLVGNTPEAYEIARIIEANEGRGMRVFGFAVAAGDASRETVVESPVLRRPYPVYPLSRLPELLSQNVIDEVIVAVSKDEVDKLEETFLLCEEEGVKTRVLLTFFPHVISRVSLERLQEMPLLTFSTTPENDYLILLKRVLDFVMAFILILLLSPLFLVLALLIKMTSRGPVFFRQVRCGLGGRKFTLVKFRSMHADADKRRRDLEPLNELDGPVFKIKNDPRCTPLGRFMRKFSLDELPQLFNILKGDMSFVGPRPPLPEEVEKYERWQRRRLRMLPGLTCLWALEGRSKLSFKRWMELDLEYIDRWSILLDWKILLKTIPVVLLGRGAS
ncbi:MAG TPA: sugar transferase [Terriglobia bacterium]|nr:sugar transferase [Terriglobia bacterium]